LPVCRPFTHHNGLVQRPRDALTAALRRSALLDGTRLSGFLAWLELPPAASSGR